MYVCMDMYYYYYYVYSIICRLCTHNNGEIQLNSLVPFLRVSEIRCIFRLEALQTKREPVFPSYLTMPRHNIAGHQLVATYSLFVSVKILYFTLTLVFTYSLLCFFFNS